MTRMQNGFQPSSPKKLESPSQSQYRGVNANSTGGRRDAAFMPRVTGSTTMKPRSIGDFDSKVNPVLNARSLSQQQTTYPGMVGYKGPSANDNAWADRVNGMGQDQLNSLLDAGTKAFRSQQSPANVAKNYNTYKPGSIGVGVGAPVPMIDPQNHSAFYQYGAGEGQSLIPSPSVKPSPAIEAAQRVDEWNRTYDDIKFGKRMFDAMYPKSPGNQVQSLSQTPRQNPGFSMNSPQQVSASVPPMNAGASTLRRQDVPAWSLNGGISPATASAGQAFSQSARSPSINTGQIIGDRITENMNNATAQGRQMANSMVDGRLNARMGYYAAPQARQSGFFQRGMGPMAGDASVMQGQSQPLGDGGPAAAAARANQAQRRMDAEAMMGPPKDGLTRYAVDPRLLQFANQGRMAQDSAMSSMLGSGSVYRQPMQAMTPSEIQFYRHKMNMASNPQYAQRVLQERMDRQEMLDNRREMVRARRAGALEAAGASQQLRNLQAGRGAIAGQDGFNALMSAAARQNPNEAFGSFGQAALAQAAPGMQQDRLIAEENMLATRAQLGRMQQYEDMRMQIIGSGMPEIEKQRALQSLNNSIISSGMGGSTMPAQGGGLGGGVASTTSSSGSVNGIPNWLPLPEAFPDGTVPTINRMAEYKKSLMTDPRWMQLPPEQQSQILSQIETQYFPGVRRSDREQYAQDNDLNPFNRLMNYGRSIFGLDDASMTRRQESLDAINPYRAGSAPYRPGQQQLTPEQRQAVDQLPDSRDRQLYELFMRQGRR